VVKLVVVFALCACSSVELAQPVIRARMGPAAERSVRRVVALPATCGALTLVRMETADPAHPSWVQRSTCPALAMKSIDNAIRSSLEFGGFEIIDGERVNAVTASRHEVEVRRGGELASRTTEQTGARFEDATPFEQDAILKELRADGVLNVRISVGAGSGAGQRRTIVVQVQLLAAGDRAMVWARRCELEVGGIFTTDELAMERASRCAIEGTRVR
jgi:hypothetical protein